MIPLKRNQLEVRVVGLPRSGHHGVIGWLTGHFTGDVLHYNDVAIAEHADAEKAHLFINSNDSRFRELYIFNVENRDLPWVVTGINTNRWKTYNGPSDATKYMLVLRDPYNNFASYWKMFGPDSFFSSGIAYRWKQYAREFLGLTNFLPKDTVKVSFSEWFTNEAYRRRISECFGLTFSDARLHEPYGAASAFENDVADARQRKALDRWRSFSTDPNFLSIFTLDPELHELAAEIFRDFAVSIRNSLDAVTA